MTKVGFLMNVFSGDCPKLFKNSFINFINQDYQHILHLLIIDGPVSDDIHKIISEYKSDKITILRLKHNIGLSKSRNKGIDKLKDKVDYIAINDPDDISCTSRITKQVNFIRANNLDVCSSFLYVNTEENNAFNIRPLPLFHDQIYKFAPFICPIHQPSVMFKTSIGKNLTYRSFFPSEDYYLWIELLIHGYKFGNMAEPLVTYYQPNRAIIKRAGLNYFINDLRVRVLARKLVPFRFWVPYIFVSVMISSVRLLPSPVFKYMYLFTQTSKKIILK